MGFVVNDLHQNRAEGESFQTSTGKKCRSSFPRFYLQWQRHATFKVVKQGCMFSLVFYIYLVIKICKIKLDHSCFKFKESGNEKITGSTIYFLCSFRTPAYLFVWAKVLVSTVPVTSSNTTAPSKPTEGLSAS